MVFKNFQRFQGFDTNNNILTRLMKKTRPYTQIRAILQKHSRCEKIREQ
jgi:hypothetical protein